MVFMPPRHGKSELVSRRFPAWYLGNNPDRSIIAASYNSDLATDFGREVRDVVASAEYNALFQTTLAVNSKAANRWHTNGRGGYVAAGVGTAVTGRGAHKLLIDDPLKDREEADSEKIREKVWRWYTSTAYTRLESDFTDDPDWYDDDDLWTDFYDDVQSGDAEPIEGGICLVQTRWHEDDLGGRLLEAQETGGDQWEVLELPAISNDNKALWQVKYPLERLEAIRTAIGSRDWSALYQQRPAPEEGTFFKREWFGWYDEPPAVMHKYGGSDYAVTEGKGDYTCHAVVGIDHKDDLYVLDLWRGQTESNVWIERLLDMMSKHEPLMWAEEQGQIIKSVGPFLQQRMNERGKTDKRVYCAREQFVSIADKPTRARSFQARCAQGKVWLPRNAPWVADFLSELLTFPAGKNDDQVDTVALIGRMLAEMVGGVLPEKDEGTPDRWDRAFAKMDDGDGSWKSQ